MPLSLHNFFLMFVKFSEQANIGWLQLLFNQEWLKIFLLHFNSNERILMNGRLSNWKSSRTQQNAAWFFFSKVIQGNPRGGISPFLGLGWSSSFEGQVQSSFCSFANLTLQAWAYPMLLKLGSLQPASYLLRKLILVNLIRLRASSVVNIEIVLYWETKKYSRGLV